MREPTKSNQLHLTLTSTEAHTHFSIRCNLLPEIVTFLCRTTSLQQGEQLQLHNNDPSTSFYFVLLLRELSKTDHSITFQKINDLSKPRNMRQTKRDLSTILHNQQQTAFNGQKYLNRNLRSFLITNFVLLMTEVVKKMLKKKVKKWTVTLIKTRKLDKNQLHLMVLHVVQSLVKQKSHERSMSKVILTQKGLYNTTLMNEKKLFQGKRWIATIWQRVQVLQHMINQHKKLEVCENSAKKMRERLFFTQTFSFRFE